MPPIFERRILVLSWNRGARRREREMGKFPVKDSVQRHRPRPGTMRHDGKFKARGARELLLPSKLLKTWPNIPKTNHLRRIGWFRAEPLWREWFGASFASLAGVRLPASEWAGWVRRFRPFPANLPARCRKHIGTKTFVPVFITPFLILLWPELL
jgi:hypothetical protein